MVAFLLPFLSSCLSEEVWDPMDPRCAQHRQSNVRGYWNANVMGLAYSWIDDFGHDRQYLLRTIVNVTWSTEIRTTR